MIAILAGLLLTACGGAAPGSSGSTGSGTASGGGGSSAPVKITLFSQQQVQTMAFEYAQEKGFFKQEGLEVSIRYFASGTTAFQSFAAGAGDIIFSGDVPAISYWTNHNHDYRVLAPVERNAKGYALVTKASITTPQQLEGKKIAIKVGSTGSAFMWAYEHKYNIPESSVTLVNMDGPTAISALDKGDIDGFFYWAPFPDRALEVSGSKVHVLADASAVAAGYYTVIGARPEWIQAHKAAVVGFLKAAREGQAIAEKNKSDVEQYLKAKFNIDPASSGKVWDEETYLLSFPTSFFQDWDSLAGWMKTQGLLKENLDWPNFAYTDALKQIDPSLVQPLPKAQ